MSEIAESTGKLSVSEAFRSRISWCGEAGWLAVQNFLVQTAGLPGI